MIFFCPFIQLDNQNNLFNQTLDQPLVNIDPKYIWNLDEKPLIPDLINGAAVSFDGQRTQPLTGNRGLSWTLLFWTSAAGESIAPLVIFPEPLAAQSADLGLALLSNPCTEAPTDIQPRISFAPNGWMNTLTFEHELRLILPQLRKSMPFDQAGLLIFDAHSTHISTRSIQIARFFGFHLLTIPSHCSILLQPLDNFFNGEFSRFYRQMYQDAWVHNRVPRASDKLRSVLRAFRETSKKSSECREAWRRCGIKDGFPSPEALRPEKFFVGQSFRDASCPLSRKTIYEFFFHGRIFYPKLAILSQEMLWKNCSHELKQLKRSGKWQWNWFS